MSDASRHALFFVDTIIFRVDDCLFKVPRKPFETESIAFKNMFLLPTGDLPEEGSSDENPIHLTGVTKDEFEQLLRVLLHRPYGMTQKSLPETIDQWTSALKLASLWGFDSIRQAAINCLRYKASPAERIGIGRTFHLDLESWSLPAMHEIVRREQPISFEEGQRMGLEIALKLASVREQVSVRQTFNPGFGGSSQLEFIPGRRPNVEGLDFTQILRAAFAPSKKKEEWEVDKVDKVDSFNWSQTTPE